MNDSDASTDPDSSAAGWTLGDVFGRPHDASLVWFLLPSLVAFAGLGLVPLQSWEYWWHLTVGRAINYWGAVPAANHYLYTMPADAGSAVPSWLADLLLYGLHVNGSVHLGLVLRNTAVASAVAWCGYRTMRRSNSVVTGSIVTLAVVPLVFASAALGPSVFVWLLLPPLLEGCYRVDRGDLHPAWLIGIPVVAAIWANVHSAFWIAALLPALFAVAAAVPFDTEGAERSGPEWYVWAVAAATVCLAGMVNPRGPALYQFVAEEWFQTPISGVPGGLVHVTPLDPAVAGPWWFACWLAAGALLVWRRASVDPVDAILVGALGLIAVLHADGMVAFSLGVPVAVAPTAGRTLGELDPTDTPNGIVQRIYTVGALLCLAAAFGFQPTWQWRVDWTARSSWFDLRSRAPLAGVAPAETPHEPVEILARRVDPPRLFHDRRYAGYLLYHLTGPEPQQKVFVDARDALPSREVWRNYRRVFQEQSAWREIFGAHDVGAVLLSRRNEELVDRLDGSDKWSTLMQDEHFTLLVPVRER